MKAQKVLIHLGNVRDNDLASYAQKIVQRMTNNPNFTDPQPDLATLQAAITLYTAALIAAKDSTKENTASKNAARLVVENYLGTLGTYVNQNSGADLVKLDSSGFALSRLPAPIGILPAPTLIVRYGNNSGEVYFEIGFVAQATEYLVLYSPTPAPADDAEWYFTLFSSTKGTLSHLKSGTKYVFKVTATSPEANKMNTYNFSNPVEKFVP